jgi:hypothetical protein
MCSETDLRVSTRYKYRDHEQCVLMLLMCVRSRFQVVRSRNGLYGEVALEAGFVLFWSCFQ